jgi:hypothetical protein
LGVYFNFLGALCYLLAHFSIKTLLSPKANLTYAAIESGAFEWEHVFSAKSFRFAAFSSE